MIIRTLVPYLLGAVILLAIAVVASAFLVPAIRNGNDVVASAQSLVPEVNARVGTLAGKLFEQDVDLARNRADDLVRAVKSVLFEHSRVLGRWFPRIETKFGGKAPPPEEFKASYAYYQDEVVREVGGALRRSTGRDDIQVPLIEPAFVKETRLPVDEREMVAAQREFNIQWKIYKIASTRGAVPMAPPHIREGWAPWEGEKEFRETQVVVTFDVQDRAVPNLLRALLEMEREGPVVRLQGIATRPHAPPARLAADQKLTVEAEVRLALYEFAPEK